MGKLLIFKSPAVQREGPYWCGAPMKSYGRVKGPVGRSLDNAKQTDDTKEKGDDA